MMEYKISVSDVLTAFDKFLDDIGSKVTVKEKISRTSFKCFEVSLTADILVWEDAAVVMSSNDTYDEALCRHAKDKALAMFRDIFDHYLEVAMLNSEYANLKGSVGDKIIATGNDGGGCEGTD